MFAPGLGKSHKLATAQRPYGSVSFPRVSPTPTIPELIERFDSELDELREEVAWLRIALERAEALRGDESALPSPMTTTPVKANAFVRVADLTPRQHEIMEMVLAGHPSKNIAADLGISQRTVENHRAAIMKKTGSRSLPALGRFGLAAEQSAHVSI